MDILCTHCRCAIKYNYLEMYYTARVKTILCGNHKREVIGKGQQHHSCTDKNKNIAIVPSFQITEKQSQSAHYKLQSILKLIDGEPKMKLRP